MTVADTDVLIDFLENRGPAAGVVAAELMRDTLATTAVNVFELLSGARDERQRERVQVLLDSMGILPLDQEAAQRAAETRRPLEQSGLGIGMADSLIAGIVLTHGAALLTRSRRHFERVPQLRLAELPAAP